MHRLGGVEKREQMTPDDFPLPQRAKILVIILRRLGDVLMATPLLRTLRQGKPGATLDVLVFAGSERILKGNPDIDGADHAAAAVARTDARSASSLVAAV
jgi:hypothetical protein